MIDERRTLTNVKIFSCGSHPGSGPGAKREWTEPDLDSIVANFAAMSSSGQVPLKIGHSDDQPLLDNGPALGWVSSLKRAGDALVATFTDMPPELIAAIRAGRYKNLSVELMRDPEVDGKQYQGWVLDAVALLGAEAPAVRNLSDLQRLAASRRHVASGYAAQVSFAREFILPLTREERHARAEEARRLQGNPELLKAQAENESLRTELATFRRTNIEEAQREHGEALVAELEREVRAGHILPATRDQLIRLKKLNVPAEAMKFSREDLQLYVRSQDQTELLRGLTRGVVAFSRDPNSSAIHGHDPQFDQAEVVRRIFARAKDSNVDVFAAFENVVREDPALGDAILAATFE
jgi:hypothetical protein